MADTTDRADTARPAGAVRRALTTTALLCALAVPGCSAPATTDTPSAPASAGASGAATGPKTGTDTGDTGTGNTGTGLAGGLSGTDIGWLQLTIAMDDQARDILERAPDRAGDPALADWAARLAAHHRTELTALRALSAEAGLPDGNPHEGHEMPGMASAAALRELETARGPAFDRLLRTTLHAHLRQTVKLADALLAADADPRTRELARDARESAADAERTMPPA
ncbi:DUF305 domain-containing protein [Streptomyces tagetis]|uniref:DUF305 domain-containing protein n=1 Tax=Streptomyces tagetis TaxID=2820809 RepID=A0A941B1S4_9ACTN|nr:DUF305 domain-containing protein [Streptomyces sp. RG38]MBQ0826452.1 DUF305 domain-containing protein [Streptomyces sp. RG38]